MSPGATTTIRASKSNLKLLRLSILRKHGTLHGHLRREVDQAIADRSAKLDAQLTAIMQKEKAVPGRDKASSQGM